MNILRSLLCKKVSISYTKFNMYTCRLLEFLWALIDEKRNLKTFVKLTRFRTTAAKYRVNFFSN